MTVRFLTIDQVVRINDRKCGGLGVRDRAVLEGAIARPQVSLIGAADPYPSLYLKAAILLESLSQTQGFNDGNKRTAWLAAIAFLELNGSKCRTTFDDVTAEVFVRAVVADAVEPELIAEWLDTNTTSGEQDVVPRGPRYIRDATPYAGEMSLMSPAGVVSTPAVFLKVRSSPPDCTVEEILTAPTDEFTFVMLAADNPLVKDLESALRRAMRRAGPNFGAQQ